MGKQASGGPRPDPARKMTNDPDCVFCQMVAGSVEVVDRNALSVAVRPPVERAPGHLLFIAATHFTDVARHPRAGATVFEHIARYAKHHELAVDVVTGLSAAPHRRPWHHYMHMVPRTPDDALGKAWPWPEGAE